MDNKRGWGQTGDSRKGGGKLRVSGGGGTLPARPLPYRSPISRSQSALFVLRCQHTTATCAEPLPFANQNSPNAKQARSSSADHHAALRSNSLQRRPCLAPECDWEEDIRCQRLLQPRVGASGSSKGPFEAFFLLPCLSLPAPHRRRCVLLNRVKTRCDNPLAIKRHI